MFLKEFVEKYSSNPSKVKYEGKTYTDSDLAAMDSEDYEELIEEGAMVVEE